jgi:hypothetical protein
MPDVRNNEVGLVKWRDWRLAAYSSLGALLLSVVAAVQLYVLPRATAVSSSSGGESVTTHVRLFSGSLLEAWVLFVPVLLCALATWSALARRRRPLLVAAVLLGLFALLGALSIGFAYVPAVVLLVLSTLATRKQRGDPPRASLTSQPP